MSKKLILPAILVLVIVLSGCTAPAPAGTGNLVLQITDQPNLNIQKADLTISKIQVHMSSHDESNESSWITVLEGPQTYDLVAIKDVKEFLGEKELAVGIYTQIRLGVDSALVTISGTEYNLTIPSKTVKLVRSFRIIENQTTVLTLDFNAQDSIHAAGDKYIMTPAIQVIQESAAANRSKKSQDSEIKPPEDFQIKSPEQSCTDSRGIVAISSCCKSAKDFPDTCLIGACGCSAENSHEILTCECGPGACFNGTACVAR